MTRTDHRIIFTALGFLAVILRDNVAENKQAIRATSIARLIESFCATSLPEAFRDGHLPYSGHVPVQDIEQLTARYVEELCNNGSATLEAGRETLLQMYELLTLQEMRHEQHEFYQSGSEEMIATHVLHLAEKQANWKQSS